MPSYGKAVHFSKLLPAQRTADFKDLVETLKKQGCVTKITLFRAVQNFVRITKEKFDGNNKSDVAVNLKLNEHLWLGSKIQVMEAIPTTAIMAKDSMVSIQLHWTCLMMSKLKLSRW